VLYNRRLSVFVLLFVLFVGVGFAADAHQSEIDHLLRYVEGTNCKYERNGAQYTGKEAARHMRKKAEHFKDKISTAEDFIALSATKSEVSGKPYMIHCPEQPVIRSRDWLLRELSRFRQKQSF
jgi:hypothetical protein